MEVNRKIAGMPDSRKSAFPGVLAGVKAAHRLADVAVVWSANGKAVQGEWNLLLSDSGESGAELLGTAGLRSFRPSGGGNLWGRLPEPADPKISGESGEVFIGRAGTAEDGVFFLKIVWEEDSCIITPVFQEDMKIHTQETDGGVLNYNEIVSRFRAYTPSELGLSGESMEEYSIFPEEGYVMVNDQPGIRVNIYNPSTHAYQASYIITADGSHVFQWDRKTQQIVELPVK